ncbi:MAG TPA: hypothetical protein VMN04_02835 [Thermoanaerobaculia bacterium]|nr:hypothetical protein [Thermoanaerobaculia bacterium]
MEAGTLVLVHLVAPREKYWGVLVSLSPAGMTLRGLELDLFEEWARQQRPGADPELGVTTLFVPLHRVEKIFEDTRIGSVASYAERFFEIVGRDVREVLRAAPPVADTPAPN